MPHLLQTVLFGLHCLLRLFLFWYLETVTIFKTTLKLHKKPVEVVEVVVVVSMSSEGILTGAAVLTEIRKEKC